MDQRDDSFDRTPAEPNPKLFVGSLAWAATDEDLQALFSPIGELVSASVVKYPDTGRSKGFGFVEYSSTEEAQKAKDELDGKEIAGRAIKIDFARPRKERTEER